MTTALGWSCWQGMHLGGRGHLGLVCGGDPGRCMGDSCPGNIQAKQTWETPRVLAGLGQGLIFTAVSDTLPQTQEQRGGSPPPPPLQAGTGRKPGPRTWAGGRARGSWAGRHQQRRWRPGPRAQAGLWRDRRRCGDLCGEAGPWSPGRWGGGARLASGRARGNRGLRSLLDQLPRGLPLARGDKPSPSPVQAGGPGWFLSLLRPTHPPPSAPSAGPDGFETEPRELSPPPKPPPGSKPPPSHPHSSVRSSPLWSWSRLLPRSPFKVNRAGAAQASFPPSPQQP